MHNIFTRLFLLLTILVLTSCGSGTTGGSSGGSSSQELVQEVPGLGTVTFDDGTFTSDAGGDVSGSLSITSALESYSYSFMLDIPESLIALGATVKYTKADEPGVLLDECIVTRQSPSCGFIFSVGTSLDGSYNIDIYYADNNAVEISTRASKFSKLSKPIVLVVADNSNIPPEPPEPPAPVVESGVLAIVVNESQIMVGESGLVTVSLADSQNVTTAVIVTVASSNESIATVSPSSCSLTTINNTCQVAFTGESVGHLTINVEATGYTMVTSSSIEITPSILNQWAWMGGSQETNQPGVYGIQGQESSGNIPGGRIGSVSWVDKNGDFWIFGGNGSSGMLNDVWKYSESSHQWAWMGGSQAINQPGVYGIQGQESSGNIPSGRTNAISWVDKDGNFWLYGGINFSNGLSALNDLWKYSESSHQWAWMGGSQAVNQPGVYGIQGQESSGNIPGGRLSATSWIDEDGNFWLFGGVNGGFASLNDLWKYSESSHQWAWMSGSESLNQRPVYGIQGQESSGNIPGAGSGAVSWVDESGDLWLLGGAGFIATGDDPVSLNDVWKYSLSSHQWTWVSGSSAANQDGIYGVKGVESSGNAPGGISYATVQNDGKGNIWVFGGYCLDSLGTPDYLSNVWKYSLASQQWTWMNGYQADSQSAVYGTLGIESSANTPGGRSLMVSWMGRDGNLWIFGGNIGFKLNDLWRYRLSK